MSKIKNLRSLASWVFKHRKNGVPVQFFEDEMYLDWFYNYRPALLKFRDIHKGKDCFIMGNGPSLNKMDLAPLNDYYVFGLNKIHLIFDKVKLNFSYHAAVNPLVIEQMEAELNADVFKCPSFVSYTASRPFKYKNTNVHRLLTTGPWSFNASVDQPISEGFTVTYVAIQLAFYMGFENVFLIGVDHNFVQKGKPNEKQLHDKPDENHFHPDYFKGHQWHLADLEGNEASYALAKHQFHVAGREIYDATLNGKLNIFSKISFGEALAKARRK